MAAPVTKTPVPSTREEFPRRDVSYSPATPGFIETMARLHPNLRDALDHLPHDRPVHLFTRHSVREESPHGFADYRLPLTPEGVRIAEEWGAELGRSIASFWSSPVQRCVHTAEALRRGGARAGLVAHDMEVRITRRLVEPGCFVRDVGTVGPAFLRMGAVAFLNHHLRERMDGLLTPLEGRDVLLDYLRRRQPEPGSLAVHVTHDTILIAFLAALAGFRKIRERDWPWMMEGLWLWFEGDSVRWIWRGEHGDLDLS